MSKRYGMVRHGGGSWTYYYRLEARSFLFCSLFALGTENVWSLGNAPRPTNRHRDSQIPIAVLRTQCLPALTAGSENIRHVAKDCVTSGSIDAAACPPSTNCLAPSDPTMRSFALSMADSNRFNHRTCTSTLSNMFYDWRTRQFPFCCGSPPSLELVDNSHPCHQLRDPCCRVVAPWHAGSFGPMS